MNNGISYSSDIRVRYADTDAMKIVYHGKYLEYFEESRSEMLRFIGLPYSEIEKMGIYVVVLEANAKYFRSAQYDDILHVRATIKETPTMKFTIEYEITSNNNSEILVAGFTKHSFLNAQTRKPARPPKEFIAIMEKYFQGK